MKTMFVNSVWAINRLHPEKSNDALLFGKDVLATALEDDMMCGRYAYTTNDLIDLLTGWLDMFFRGLPHVTVAECCPLPTAYLEPDVPAPSDIYPVFYPCPF